MILVIVAQLVHPRLVNLDLWIKKGLRLQLGFAWAAQESQLVLRIYWRSWEYLGKVIDSLVDIDVRYAFDILKKWNLQSLLKLYLVVWILLLGQDALDVYVKLPQKQYNTGWVLSQVSLLALFRALCLVDLMICMHQFKQLTSQTLASHLSTSPAKLFFWLLLCISGISELGVWVESRNFPWEMVATTSGQNLCSQAFRCGWFWGEKKR